MVIILPNKIDGLAALTEKLEEVTTECSTRLTQTYEREVRVFLPKFRTESKLDLEDTLSKKVRRNVWAIIKQNKCENYYISFAVLLAAGSCSTVQR